MPIRITRLERKIMTAVDLILVLGLIGMAVL